MFDKGRFRRENESMRKTIAILPAAAALAALCGCSGMGANWNVFDEELTPNTGAETTVRTWDEGADGRPSPTVREVPNDPPFPN